MQDAIINEICRFIREDAGNRRPDGSGPLFDRPLVGFAAAADPLFAQYKTIIGEFHLTPAEFAAAGPGAWAPGTVICWILPIVEPTRRSNRPETAFPSRAWSETRQYGEACNAALRRHLVDYLQGEGYHALAPQLHPSWREYHDNPSRIASSWSERHAAYAAGLGTFSLNDGFITPKGIAHRVGSVITDLVLEPSPRPYPDHTHNCLWHRNATCGACIGRCPVGAITREGHDKAVCREYVYGTAPQAVAERYQVTATGCGLCQTKVPCESRIPQPPFP